MMVLPQRLRPGGPSPKMVGALTINFEGWRVGGRGGEIRIACPCGEVVDRRATPEESEILSPLTQQWSAESLRLEVTVWSSTNISAQVARSGTLPRFGISDLQRVGKSTCASTSIWPYRRMSRAAGRFLNDIGVVAGLGTTARFP